MHTKQTLLKYLETLDIPHQTYEHEPLFTVEQAQTLTARIPGAQCKNLFLKDNSKQLWLIVALTSTQIQLKQLANNLKAPGLRFAQADILQKHLGVEPGSVTPFGSINDTEHNVMVILDSQLFKHELIGFHPLVNTATTVLSPLDLEKFLISCNCRYSQYTF